MMAHSSDIAFLIAQNKQRPSKPRETDIAKWIETRRILPSSTPFPGAWRNERTPYLKEIMNCMSPDSPVQHVAIMKGAQLGLTAAAENVVAYWIDETPAEILFVSATEKLLEKWAIKRLDPMIDSCGIRGKITAQNNNPKSRRTGDKIFSKEYFGGTLDMASAQSAPGLRSDSKRILIRDEIDGAPPQLKSGEGNWLEVSYARTAAWGNRKKIMDFSTPTTDDLSLIKGAYEAGDQRKYEVPCPYCGAFQVLEWGTDKTEYGIKAQREGGQLIAVHYQCRHCGEPIKNHHKTKMLREGRWTPTAKSSSAFYRSYHISSLYSPAGMMSWFELQELWDKAQTTGDPDSLRAFINLYLGLPYRETGERPKIEKVVELRGDYKSGTVPHGVLFLTAAIDVQSGSSRDKSNPARLEMEVCGHGLGYRTWSIEYRRFEGEVDDPAAGAWLALSEWATKTEMKYIRPDGFAFHPAIIFIDSGDGNLTDVVYRFCSGWPGTFPSKGFSALKKRPKEAGDEQSPFNFKRFRVVKIGESTFLYEISTNLYKKHHYNNLKIARQDPGPQNPGYCDFPIDYTESYFRMLIAEERRRDGSFHLPSGRRNESLDCRVMNLCASDVHLENMVGLVRAEAIRNGSTKDQVQVITTRTILDYMAKRVAPISIDHGTKEE